jgi:hypothetical protein
MWVLVFGILSICLCPVASFIGGLSSALQPDFVARTPEPLVCPDGSTAEVTTFQTTSRDEFGNEEPAIRHEMQCIDARGNIVRESSPDFAYYWVGLLMGGSLIVSGLLALLLAAPVGLLVARLMPRSRKAGTA